LISRPLHHTLRGHAPCSSQRKKGSHAEIACRLLGEWLTQRIKDAKKTEPIRICARTGGFRGRWFNARMQSWCLVYRSGFEVDEQTASPHPTRTRPLVTPKRDKTGRGNCGGRFGGLGLKPKAYLPALLQMLFPFVRRSSHYPNSGNHHSKRLLELLGLRPKGFPLGQGQAFLGLLS